MNSGSCDFVSRLYLLINMINYVSYGCLNEKIAVGRSYNQKNINISDCFFSRMSQFSENGGVIYVDGGSFSMKLSYSMFFNCSAYNGGAIYFSSLNSKIELVCASRCCCGYHSHFAYLCSSVDNQVDYLSISLCSPFLSLYHPILLYTGYQKANNNNCSLNCAQYHSGFSFQLSNSFSSSFCTFSNNKASDYI